MRTGECHGRTIELYAVAARSDENVKAEDHIKSVVTGDAYTASRTLTGELGEDGALKQTAVGNSLDKWRLLNPSAINTACQALMDSSLMKLCLATFVRCVVEVTPQRFQ